MQYFSICEDKHITKQSTNTKMCTNNTGKKYRNQNYDISKYWARWTSSNLFERHFHECLKQEKEWITCIFNFFEVFICSKCLEHIFKFSDIKRKWTRKKKMNFEKTHSVESKISTCCVSKCKGKQNYFAELEWIQYSQNKCNEYICVSTVSSKWKLILVFSCHD